MDDVPAVAIQHGDQEVKRAPKIHVRDVQMPVFMRPIGLHKPRPFLRRRPAVTVQPAGASEHAIHACRADGHHVVVEHHERQSAVALQGMAVVVVEDRQLFPILQPPVARNLPVVLVELAVAAPPLVELAGAQTHPAQKAFGRQPRTIGPMLDVIDDLVPGIVGNPSSVQSSPLAFFARTFSSISSAMTSFF